MSALIMSLAGCVAVGLTAHLIRLHIISVYRTSGG